MPSTDEPSDSEMMSWSPMARRLYSWLGSAPSADYHDPGKNDVLKTTCEAFDVATRCAYSDPMHIPKLPRPLPACRSLGSSYSFEQLRSGSPKIHAKPNDSNYPNDPHFTIKLRFRQHDDGTKWLDVTVKKLGAPPQPGSVTSPPTSDKPLYEKLSRIRRSLDPGYIPLTEDAKSQLFNQMRTAAKLAAELHEEAAASTAAEAGTAATAVPTAVPASPAAESGDDPDEDWTWIDPGAYF